MDNLALKDAMASVAQDLERVLDPILAVPEGNEAQLYEAMRHSVYAGGKRIRPFLVCASADLFGVERQHSLRVAAALECVHCYSLVHDDLPAMDDDDMRRGKPTVHVAFDEATAILAGDGLLTLAFEILSNEKTHPDPRVRCKLVEKLAKASGGQGMVGGQMIDLTAEDHDLDERGIFRLQNLKTGALISFAVDAGAILAGASKEAHASLLGYARDFGLAFQIADDLLDVEGSAEEVGKAVGKDEDAGKATLIGIMGVDRARRQARILTDQAIEHLSGFDEKAALLRAVADFAINRRT